MYDDLEEEQQHLVQSVRALSEARFAEKAFTWQESGDYPFENLKVLSDQGLTGMILPPEQGGHGAGLFDAILAMEQIGMVCPHTADAFHVSNFGGVCQIAEFATEEAKQAALPALLSGQQIISVGMSEPDAGSAVTELRTTATPQDDGSIKLDGQKIWNSEGPHASWWVVWARFPGAGEKRDIGAVLVRRGAPGFSLGKTSYFMANVQHATLHFEDCSVPSEYVLMQQDGLRRMMSIFNIERLGNATRSLALGQTALNLAVAHAKERQQFGQRLSDMQGIQWKLADAHIRLQAARHFIYAAARRADRNGGAPSRDDTALAKYQANTAGFNAANEALQVFGAYGYDMESRVNYLFRRTRGWMIAGGTVEVLKNQIARAVLR